MKLKVCGMKHNTADVASLLPDYLGFIFWEKSSRYFNGPLPTLLPSIKKVGVFVDAPARKVLENVSKYGLDAVQLHGTESADYCHSLTSERSSNEFKLIKAFSIKDEFDFSVLEPYETSCDYYLFDTKGKLPGGNGHTFDWKALRYYPSTKPYFLSGGIGLEEIENLKSFFSKPESKYCHAIDVNSRFETAPGMKEMDALKKFKKQMAPWFAKKNNPTTL